MVFGPLTERSPPAHTPLTIPINAEGNLNPQENSHPAGYFPQAAAHYRQGLTTGLQESEKSPKSWCRPRARAWIEAWRDP